MECHKYRSQAPKPHTLEQQLLSKLRLLIKYRLLTHRFYCGSYKCIAMVVDEHKNEKNVNFAFQI